jgi:hypothetical protein
MALNICSVFCCFTKNCLAERLALIRQQRAEAAKKRDEEKNGMIRVALTVLT